MEQMSFFDSEKIEFPMTHEDVLKLHEQYIYEGEKDKDAFECKDIKNGHSYYFYGIKVMEHTVSPSGKVKFSIKQKFGDEDGAEDNSKFIAIPFDADILYYMELLKKAKRTIFRNTITETFACCNDYERCSDARKCLKTEDRMYNGCLYRTNLEAGRIFYGKNKTI